MDIYLLPSPPPTLSSDVPGRRCLSSQFPPNARRYIPYSDKTSLFQWLVRSFPRCVQAKGTIIDRLRCSSSTLQSCYICRCGNRRCDLSLSTCDPLQTLANIFPPYARFDDIADWWDLSTVAGCFAIRKWLINAHDLRIVRGKTVAAFKTYAMSASDIVPHRAFNR